MRQLKGKHAAEVLGYAEGVVSGSIIANPERVQGCQRFLDMLCCGRYEVRTQDADFVIGIIETTFCHRQGETLDALPLEGKPFLLEPWEKFCVYGMLAFFYPGTRERVVKEAFIFIPRKNGKTMFTKSAVCSPLTHTHTLSFGKVPCVCKVTENSPVMLSGADAGTLRRTSAK